MRCTTSRSSNIFGCTRTWAYCHLWATGGRIFGSSTGTSLSNQRCTPDQESLSLAFRLATCCSTKRVHAQDMRTQPHHSPLHTKLRAKRFEGHGKKQSVLFGRPQSPSAFGRCRFAGYDAAHAPMHATRWTRRGARGARVPHSPAENRRGRQRTV